MDTQKSEVFLVIVAVLVLALYVNREHEHDFQSKHPPMIRLSEEDARYSFETGSFELTPAYRRALRGLVPRILELLRDCRCDTLEVIGTADNMPLATTSDLDLQIHGLLRKETDAVIAAGSSNDLSLLRAVAVLTFLRSIPELGSISYWAPLSRSQTLMPDGTLDLVGKRVSDPARRSIEIRFLSSNTEGEQYLYTAFAPHEISTAAEAVAFARLLQRGGDRENCVLFFLDAEHRIISAHGRVGTEEMCRFEYPDDVPKGAAGILVAHNHPKGAPSPSGADRRAVEVHRRDAESLGLKLLDCIVWTDTEYSSVEDFGVSPMRRAGMFFGTAPRQTPVPEPREAPDSFVWPLAEKGRVGPGFGWHDAPKGSLRHSFHAGIDILAAAGTGIRALGAGTVRRIGENTRTGQFVELDLGSGWTAFYAHLDEVTVEAGTAVEPGQVIAKIAQPPGRAAPALHLVVKDSGALVDPMPLLAFRSTAKE